MNLIRRTIRFLAAPLEAMRERSQEAGLNSYRDVGPLAAKEIAISRTAMAPVMRDSVRRALMFAGYSAFALVQLVLAYEIVGLRTMLIVGTMVATICLLTVVFRPTIAFLGWVVIAPIATLLFSVKNVDVLQGLPAITFERTLIYPLAVTLAIRALIRREISFHLRLAEWLMLMFPAYLLCTTLFFPHLSEVNIYLLVLQRAGDLCIVYFTAKAVIRERKHIVWVLTALCVTGVYASIMGFYDHFTGHMSVAALVGYKVELIWGDVGGRAAGPFLGPPELGLVLGICIASTLYLFFSIRNAAARVFLFAAILLMTVAWFWTYTRGSYALLAFVVLLMPFLARRARRSYAITLAVITFVVAVVLPVLLSNPAILTRFTNTRTVDDRVVSGYALVNIIKHNPIFGVGLGNHYGNMVKYAGSIGDVPGLSIYLGLGSWGNVNKLLIHTASHNTYLTMFAEHGVVGGLIWFGGLVAFIVLLWKMRGKLPVNSIVGSDFAALVMAIIVGYMISVTTFHNESKSYSVYILYTLMAMVIRAYDINVQSPDSPQLEVEVSKDA